MHGNVLNNNAEHPSYHLMLSSWIDNFLALNGDQDPTTNNIHVPSYYTAKSLYELFTEDHKQVETTPSLSTFTSFLHVHYAHVHFLKHTRLGRCRFCMEFQEKKKQVHSEQELEDLKAAAQQHHALHTSERSAYQLRCTKAEQDPATYASIVLDCPRSYELPHIEPVTKDTWSPPKVAVSAVGTISHSTSHRNYFFFLPFWTKNPNLILTVLFFQIVQLLATLSSSGHHPPILFLQLDNAASENKNRYLLAFLSWLVYHKWFFEIVVCFLPPGHTHIDIDQMFSTFAIWLLSHSVFFISNLVDKLKTCYKPHHGGTFLPHIYNWKGFFAPHMKDIKGLSAPHAFLIRLQPDNSVGIKFKTWVTASTPWEGFSGHSEQWLSIMRTYPDGIICF